MKLVKHFFHETYSLHKFDYWLVISLNIIFGIFFTFVNVNEVIQGLIIFMLLLKTFYFMKTATVMPSITSDFDRFSWKYFQSLPMNKKQIIQSLVAVNIFVMSPFLVWGLSFISQLTFMLTEAHKVNYGAVFLAFYLFFPVMTLFGLSSISHQISYPRRQYSKINPKLSFLEAMQAIFVLLAALLYGSFGYLFLVELIGFNPITTGVKFFIPLFKFIIGWPLLILVPLFVYNVYRSTIRNWQDEKYGYVKNRWNNRRDVPITIFAAIMVFAPISIIDFETPSTFDDGSFQKSVYKKNWTEIKKFAANKEKINLRNRYGLTPLHVAVLNNDFKAYEYLLEQGADPAVSVMSKRDSDFRGMDVMRLAIYSNAVEIMDHLLKNKYNVERVVSKQLNTPLHYAASTCRTIMIDKLIAHNANVNAVNTNGNTPLHLSSSERCFGAVTSLIEAGANPILKNKKGKLALDMFEKTRAQELSYYLEKKTRAPASVKR